MSCNAPLIQYLKERDLIAQITDSVNLEALLSEQSISLYCGFDPTADSLHLGHLVPLLMLKRFQEFGHRPIALVGGATGMIGDPSFKAVERKLNTIDTIAAWGEKIRSQLAPFLNFEGNNPAILTNNYDWFERLNTLDFLRDIGKHFSVNSMINKESVKQRINRNEVGISFTEFSYTLLQAYDFVQLNSRHDCKLQIGGSDQWGNITAGIDLTRRLNQQTVFGLTVPLVTKSDGTKFGKTESGAVWLDSQKTSPYKFYQFWLGVADADVYRFMKYFTFMSLAEIAEIEANDKASNTAPQAQKILAEQVTSLVHGEEAKVSAQRISLSLFAEDQAALDLDDFKQLELDGLPTCQLNLAKLALLEALVEAKLAGSKTQAKSFIESNAVTINGKKITDLSYVLTEQDQRHGRYTLLRRGKKNHALLCWN